MTSCYWGSSSSAAERHDPSLPYLEQYRIDLVQFTQLFTALGPWVCGSHTPTLSARLFRILDQNQDGLVNFKEFITGLSKSRLWKLRLCKTVLCFSLWYLFVSSVCFLFVCRIYFCLCVCLLWLFLCFWVFIYCGCFFVFTLFVCVCLLRLFFRICTHFCCFLCVCVCRWNVSWRHDRET